MTDAVSRRGFLRKCTAAAVAALALPAIVGAAARPAIAGTTAGPGQWADPVGEYANEVWHDLGGGRWRIEQFMLSSVRTSISPRPEAPGLEWLITEDTGPDVLPISICG